MEEQRKTDRIDCLYSIEGEQKIYNFDACTAIENCINWIRTWYRKTNPEQGKKIIIGMSGGKDSTICAGLLVKALGKDKIIGVSLPEVEHNELAQEICEFLGIEFREYFIGNTVESIVSTVGVFQKNAVTNIPPRIRMTYLYAIAQSVGGYVVNTCNYSEDYIGYSTIFGDLAGAFAPLANFTVTEIRAIGTELGIPAKWVYKVPSDDLPFSCGDEEKFGFSYSELDAYLREGKTPRGFDNKDVTEKIETMHRNNLFKLRIVQIPKPEFLSLIL